jgi:hypothetical protein
MVAIVVSDGGWKIKGGGEKSEREYSYCKKQQ